MSTFSLPEGNPAVEVKLPPNLTKDQLLSFRAFKTWHSTLQKSLSQQSHKSHEFHKAPYSLRSIDVQAVDFFGGNRLGFVKLKAEVSNDDGEHLPASALLRGGSVAMLLTLQPDDAPSGSEEGKQVILTIQPRIPAGSLAFSEIPAGMIDDSGTFSGAAAKEIQEETGLSISEDELIDMTSLALSDSEDHLQKAMYPSAGGSDEFIPIFLGQKRLEKSKIEELRGKLTGLREDGEKITLKLVPLERLWREGARDGKSLAAWALYEGLRREKKI